MRILGIDPGSLATGFGVVERLGQGEGEGQGDELRHVVHGTIRPPRGAEIHHRLAVIFKELERVVEQHAPDRAVVEKVFVAASPRSALVLGQARGAALAALGAAGVPVVELAAREIKKAVVGTGNASKAQVQAMVVELLHLESRPGSDAADALAGAICSANANQLAEMGVRSGRGRRGRTFRARSLSDWRQTP